MPDIRPFRGTLYNPQKIDDIARVVSEPYDVISPPEQKAYYRAHPYNIIRLILGKRYSGDNSRNNQYTRAVQFLADWAKKDILQTDRQRSIYIYAQTFPHNHQRKVRTGFIALLKLEDFAKNAVLPHENTNSQAVQDRLKLLKAVSSNLSPIFAMFIDPEGKVNKILSRYKKQHRPYINIKKNGVFHRVWRMSDKRKTAAIKKLLRGRQIFIADGHHRYEAALNFKMQMQRQKKHPQGARGFDYVMTYLVATADRGLTILPTHRVMRIKGGFRLPRVIHALSRTCEVHKFHTSDELFAYMGSQGSAARIFGAYFGKNRFCALKLKHSGVIEKFIDKDKHGLHKNLDVVVLHGLIIERILDFLSFEEDIHYTRDAQEAIKLVNAGKYRVSFFLRPATVAQVKSVAKAGGRMPHKSTYFYPKLLSGLVINRLEDR